MNKITLLLSLFLMANSYAQHITQSDNQEVRDRLAEAEMKAAYRTSNFVANLNTGNYNVGHTTLQLSVDPAVQYISGVITTAFTAKENMSSITFDLSDNLTVSSVTQGTTSLSFLQDSNDQLIISLPQTLTTGAESSVTITYEGAPMSTGFDSFVSTTHNGSPILWTLSEPYGAKDWWPCKQDLIDKIDGVDVYITAPSQYVAVSNGVEEEAITNDDGTKTTHFAHSYAIPAYLVAIAVTNYTVFTQTAGTAPNTFPIVNYLYPENYELTHNQVMVTPAIMDFYELTFETYPFSAEKYGHAQCGFGGGMEHTTVSFMGGFNRELIAHELAHQWFGDKITCGSWKDIWLNEGFATYLTGLVVENQDGDAGFTNWKMANVNNITSQPGGAVYLTNTDTITQDRIFSSRLSYNKGAMVLHMLRIKMGDANFFQGVKNYLADEDLAYGYAKTPDFKAHMEEAGNTDLTEFFNDWVYNQGYPSYNAIVGRGEAGRAVVTLQQTQSHESVSFFESPVPLRFYSSSGQTFDIIVDNTVNNQQIDVVLPFNDFSRVEIDPDYDIIAAYNAVTLSNEVQGYNRNIVVYPNPANNKLNLLVPEGVLIESAVFYNVLGQKVLQSGSQSSFDVSSLATGIHFITLVTNNGTQQLKFIKE
jgi:aminopeptidase N